MSHLLYLIVLISYFLIPPPGAPPIDALSLAIVAIVPLSLPTFQRCTVRMSVICPNVVIVSRTFFFRCFQRVCVCLLFRFESSVTFVFFLFFLLWCLRQLSDGGSMSLKVIIFTFKGLSLPPCLPDISYQI